MKAIAFFLLLALAALPAAAADWRKTDGVEIVVSTNAELQRAIGAAKDGQAIVLAPGTYARLVVREIQHDVPVVIRSRDPARPAHLIGADVTNVRGLWFQDLLFAPAASNPQLTGYLVNVRRSSGIAIVASELHARVDDDFPNDLNGVHFFEQSDNVLFAGNYAHHLGRGIVTGASRKIRIADNRFLDMRTDGADFAGVQEAEIDGNFFTRFHPVPPDHPDFIQFWTRGAAPSEHIYIHDNVMLQGHERSTQGIFVGNEVPGWVYRDFVIERNIIYNSSPHGISFYDVIGGRIANNTVVQFPGGNYPPRINLMGAQDIEVTGNVMPQLNQDKRAERNRIGENLETRNAGTSSTLHPSRLFVDPNAGATATAASLAPLVGGRLLTGRVPFGALSVHP